jgi:SAM-dependent methyltransferase
MAPMADHWAERTWRPYGRTNPYYGVLTDERFRADQMDAESRRAFFRSGEEHVEWVLENVRRTVAPGFTPARVLDFGCGVGRLVLPFARIAQEVVGADISPEMLREGERNARDAELHNASFVRVDETLDSVPGRFDLVHAFIVFQHIPPARGERIAMRLVDRLMPGGVGALHFTYRRQAPALRKVVNALRKVVPGVNLLVNLAQHRPFTEPYIPMYRYRIDRLVDGFRRAGCSEVHMMLTDHGGYLGAMMLFRRDASS